MYPTNSRMMEKIDRDQSFREAVIADRLTYLLLLVATTILTIILTQQQQQQNENNQLKKTIAHQLQGHKKP